MSLTLRGILILVSVASALLIVLLSISSANTNQLGKEYNYLIIANICLVIMLILVTLAVVRRAWLRYKQRVFGSKLMVRLAVAFAIIGILPVFMVFTVSNQFLAKTIDTWFSNSVDVALDSGFALGRATLDAIKSDVISQTKQIALKIEEEPNNDISSIVNQYASSNNFSEITVFNEAGSILVVQGLGKSLAPDIPSSALLNRLEAAGSLVQIETPVGKDSALQVRALVLTKVIGNLEEDLIIQWIEPLPELLVRDLEALNKGFNDYEQLLLGKEGIGQIYNVTLIFTLLLAVLGSLIASVLLSSWMVNPLRSLEKATKGVALGDFRPLKTDKFNHELNDLVASFNQMMVKLNVAQTEALESARQLKISSRFFEQVLAHLTSGVMVFDKDWNLEQFNSSAQKILGCNLVHNLEKSIEKISMFSGKKSFLLEISEDFYEKPRRLDVQKPNGENLSLVLTAFFLPNVEPDNDNRIILVFDNITALLQAQKTQAWADMARGLAHEIKNPLTPIILSAERLQVKLSGQLKKDQELILTKSTKMIVEQVIALKSMIDEFQQYARLPRAQPSNVLIVHFVKEFLQMYLSDNRIKFFNNLEHDRVSVNIDKEQFLQVLHNLLQNAQDAIKNKQNGTITIKCSSLDDKKKSKIELTIEDTGPGIDEKLLPYVFEPYTTTKFKGTGLGLAIVKKIVGENDSEITLRNKKDSFGKVIGAVARIEFDRILENRDKNG